MKAKQIKKTKTTKKPIKKAKNMLAPIIKKLAKHAKNIRIVGQGSIDKSGTVATFTMTRKDGHKITANDVVETLMKIAEDLMVSYKPKTELQGAPRIRSMTTTKQLELPFMGQVATQ